MTTGLPSQYPPLVAISGGVSPTIPSGSLTDRSGTIAAGNVSQQLAAANTSRKYLLIENPTTATESLWVNFGVAAVTSQPSVEIAPGGYLIFETNFLPAQAVNVIATTIAHAFIAKEG